MAWYLPDYCFHFLVIYLQLLWEVFRVRVGATSGIQENMTVVTVNTARYTILFPLAEHGPDGRLIWAGKYLPGTCFDYQFLWLKRLHIFFATVLASQSVVSVFHGGFFYFHGNDEVCRVEDIGLSKTLLGQEQDRPYPLLLVIREQPRSSVISDARTWYFSCRMVRPVGVDRRPE